MHHHIHSLYMRMSMWDAVCIWPRDRILALSTDTRFPFDSDEDVLGHSRMFWNGDWCINVLKALNAPNN